ncbi:lytic transglycosylase [Thioalkalivibrio denitrificans]|nr:LysM peptidoglycan-binding domain-containing protein [Thioalkalivibrio denitrificans]
MKSSFAMALPAVSLAAALLLAGCSGLPVSDEARDEARAPDPVSDEAQLAGPPKPAPGDGTQAERLLSLEDSAPFPDLAVTRHIPVGEAPENNDIWGRVRAGFTMPDYRHHPRVQPHIQWHQCRQDFLHRVTARAEPLLHYILEEIEARELPTELLLLPIVESAYLPFAYSPGRAAGIWQFIPSTGRHFGLKQNWWYDGRRDIHASTQAALDYLQQLNQRFDGDWLLTLAAYNAGQGTVSRAIQRNERLGRPTDYWHLDLPRETRHYVPKLLALQALVENPWAYHVELWPVPDEPYLERVALDGQLDLAVAARLAELDVEDIYQLNPGFNRWATDPEGPHYLLLPADRAERFSEGLAAIDPGERVAWHRHRIQTGETLSHIATRYRTTVAMLQQTNNLRGTNIRAGQHLLVPSATRPSSGYTLSAEQRRSNTQARGPAGRQRHEHVVRQGDSFWALSRRYGVTVAELTRWNGVAPGDPIRPGQRLVVWLPDGERAAEVAAAGPMPASLQHVSTRRQTVTYSVRRGDSLHSIGQRFRVSVADIRRWNNLGNGSLIRPGQRLTLHVDVTNQGSGT